jgi:hypothetical protein
LQEILKEHIEKAKQFISSAEHLDALNIVNDNVYNELLKRAETQLVMAELYIEHNKD